MYDYFKGIIKSVETSFVVIDVKDIGYKVYVPNPFIYKEETEYTIYLYYHVREDDRVLYGFINTEERDFFLRIINVKGLGPKMALPMLAMGSINGIVDAIERENILYLKKFPKIGEKLAKQMILDLKGKLEASGDVKNENEDLLLALEALGYKMNDIKNVMNQVDLTKSAEEQIKEALKLLMR